MYEICAKSIFGRKIDVRSKFTCVRSSHGLYAHAHELSLEETLDATNPNPNQPLQQCINVIV